MRSQYVTRAGSTVAVDDIGSGIPVLALHGLGGGAYFFHGLARRLSHRCRLLALDLPGTGRSTSGVQPFSIDSWIADFGDVVDGLAGAPVVILGHSLGTILALEGWRRWPDRVRAMIFVGGLPSARPVIRERLEQREDHVTAHGMDGCGEIVVPGVFSPATVAASPELTALFARLFDTQPADAYLQCLRILLGASADAVVSTVRVPCLAITGADDQYAPPDAVREFARRLSEPAEPVVIPDCGHLPFLEAPRACADAVSAFLDRL